MIRQGDFRAALLDPDLPAPAGLQDAGGRPAGRRFDVYRNNVVVGLIEALATAFPVIEKILGTARFRAMAGTYVRSHPPDSPLMMHYGGRLPEFLEGFAPLAELGYLPDMARLELAIRRCYHAADASPIRPEKLAGLAPGRLVAARFRLAPAVAVLRSRWPVHAIWRFNVENAAKPRMQAEDVLLTRPELDPEIRLLPRGGAEFIQALMAGRTLEEALDGTGELDLPAMLSLLFAGRAIVEINPGANS